MMERRDSFCGWADRWQGMELYFARHDGQAVTCDDFYAAMRDGNDVKLPGFTNWCALCHETHSPVV